MVSMTEHVLSPEASLVDAIRAIEQSRRRITVVVSPDGRLLGTLTDGDVRRCLLGGGSLGTSVTQAMNPNPLSAPVGSPNGYLLDLMRRGNIIAVPLVDGMGHFEAIVHLSDLTDEVQIGAAADFVFAVIMAGGEGMRLRPITENIPKPMVDIGGVPLLERQIQRLAQVGIKRIYLSVNYLSHMIEEYFGTGEAFGVDIRYLREQQKMGTGGALSLLPEKATGPILVMNGDILTTSDFFCLYEFHSNNNADLTVATVEHFVSIPFGVVQNEGSIVTGLTEKPSQRFLCNAGIYAISPTALELLPIDRPCNMTDLIEACIKNGQTVAAFPVHEYWSDIGTHADLDKARNFYSEKL